MGSALFGSQALGASFWDPRVFFLLPSMAVWSVLLQVVCVRVSVCVSVKPCSQKQSKSLRPVCLGLPSWRDSSRNTNCGDVLGCDLRRLCPGLSFKLALFMGIEKWDTLTP